MVGESLQIQSQKCQIEEREKNESRMGWKEGVGEGINSAAEEI